MRRSFEKDSHGNRLCWQSDRNMDPQEMARIIQRDGKGCGTCWWRFRAGQTRNSNYQGCLLERYRAQKDSTVQRKKKVKRR